MCPRSEKVEDPWLKFITHVLAAPWRKQLDARISPVHRGPEFSARLLHVGFVVDEAEFVYVFLEVPPVFTATHFIHRFSTPISYISFH